MAQDPDPQELTQAAFLLRLSARPVILAGGGVARAGAESELALIAEMLDAPVITTWNGKGTIPDRSEFAAGALFGQPEARTVLESADTVFALGTRFEAGPGEGELDLPAQMIQIDSDPEQIGRKYPSRLGIPADAKAALAGILQALKAPNPLKGVADRTSVRPEERTAPARATKLRDAALSRAGRQWPEQMLALTAIRQVLPDDTTILHRHAESAPWFNPFFEVAVAGTWISSGNSEYPVSEAAAAAGAAPGPFVSFCEEDELIPHLRELEGLEEPGNITFVVFTDRSDPAKESALSEAARATALSVVVTSGPEELAAALSDAVNTVSHSILESDISWSPGAD